MPFRVILFDLDGTLADTIELIIQSGQHAFQSVAGWTPTREQILSGLGTPLQAHLGRFTSSAEQLDAVVTAYRGFQHVHHDRLVQAYDGVNDVVRWLHEDTRQLGVVTSKIEPLAHRALQLIGIDQHFDLVVGLEATTKHKPEPEPVLYAMSRLHAVPDETVYVGDSPFDIACAQAAGVASIGVTWGAFTEAELSPLRPTHLARTAAELRLLLQ